MNDTEKYHRKNPDYLRDSLGKIAKRLKASHIFN